MLKFEKRKKKKKILSRNKNTKKMKIKIKNIESSSRSIFLIFHYTIYEKKNHQIMFSPLYQKYPILFLYLFLYLFSHTRSHTHIHFFRLILLHFLILLSFLFFCLLSSSFFLRHLFFLNFKKVKSYPLSLPLSPYLQKDEALLTYKKNIFLHLRNLLILSE